MKEFTPYRNEVERRGILFPIKFFGVIFLIYAIPLLIISGLYYLFTGK